MPDTFSDSPVGDPVKPCPLLEHPTHWIEIELLGEDNKPIPWAAYRAALSDGTIVEGALDDQGFARIDGQSATGNCLITFPDLDKNAVEFLSATTAKNPT